MLVHGLDWTLTETAKFLSISPGSVNKHAERGLAKLRAAMEVQADV
jgi:DNA-directed RNA polymerase specialized sigma24 family protein